MNREVVGGGGASIYPLTGDVLSTPGSPTVTVVGLQNIPVVQKFLTGGEYLEYNISSNSWLPTLRASIQVNGVTVSDDYEISVNTGSGVSVNGVPVG